MVFGEALKSRAKFKQNLRENCSKSTNISITACKLAKFFRGSMLLRGFPCFSISFKLDLPKKMRLKK